MTILLQLTLINKELTGFWPHDEVNSTSDIENLSKKLFYLISTAKKNKKAFYLKLPRTVLCLHVK